MRERLPSVMYDILQQILYFFGRGFCHQYADRSFEAGGLVFCVCARDTGIYLGLMATLAILIILYAHLREKPAAMPPVWAIITGVLLIVPMAVDGVGSYLGLHETNNLLRYITGYLCGTGLAVIVSGGLFGLWPRANHSVSAVAKPPQLSIVLAASALVGAVFYGAYPLMGALAPFFALASMWAAVMFVVVLLVSTTRFWPRQQDAVVRRIAVLFVCFLLAGIAMTFFSLIASAVYFVLPWYIHP